MADIADLEEAAMEHIHITAKLLMDVNFQDGFGATSRTSILTTYFKNIPMTDQFHKYFPCVGLSWNQLHSYSWKR